MLKKQSSYVLKNSILVSLLIILISACLVDDAALRNSQKLSLAETLEVEPENSESEGSFPFGYFYIELKKGMTIQETHSIIKGYEKVFKCSYRSGRHYEIYYYYSSNDDVALRFQVSYDDENKFYYLLSEDTNSRSISIEGCTEGRLNVKYSKSNITSTQ